MINSHNSKVIDEFDRCDSCDEEFDVNELNDNLLCIECQQEVLADRYESYNDLD